MNKQGKLLIIGFGPGALEHITGRALAALDESEAVIGYTTYVDLIRPLLRHQEIVGTGMTEEVSRAQEAVRRAEAGQTIAVISSGDAGVYGMAGLVYEVLIERGWSRSEGVQVEVIPGISAIQSCSSLLGAPIMHDSCTISLSDHLTPWESIAARVEAAGAADFVIAFYNPRSGRRTRQIEEARNILLRYRDPATPVGIVKSAYRDRQQTVVTTLQDMLEHEIGMLSTVVVGNSATVVYEDLMITPRGYERKYSLGAQTQTLKPHERLRTAAEPWSLAAAESGQAEGMAGAVVNKGAAAGTEAGPLRLEGAVADPAAGTVRIERAAACGEAGSGLAEEAAAQSLAAAPQVERLRSLTDRLKASADSSFELEIAPAAGSRSFSGDQMKLLAELAGSDGQLVYTKDGYFLLRGSRSEETEAGARLLEAGLNVSTPGDYVKVKTCGFCELRRSGALSAAVRLHALLHGMAVPRELHISVAGCGMACSSAVLDDIGLVMSRGSYELYLGGKKSGRGAHAGILVREGMDEEEAVAAVAAAVEEYRTHGREQERYHAFRERMDSITGSAATTSDNNNIEGVQTMRTVLLVGHGSRVQAGNEELLEFTRLLAARKPELKVETCFIELASPSIAGGIARCIEGGAAEIYVVPIILFAAGHSKLDIPMAIDEAKQRYPGVKFIYGRPLGVQDRAVDILLERIQEAERLPLSQEKAAGGMDLELRENGVSKIEDKDTIVLLMGRGGSDPDANSDLYKISRLLWEKTGYRSVESCFIAIAKPSLQDGLERCLALGARKIIVLPYLLFTGVLMQQFAERVAQFAAGHPGLEVEIGGTLGAHPLLVDMLTERIGETLEGRAFSNCDNCKYRDAASLHHHHHHHHGEEGHGEHGHVHHGHGHHSHEGHGHGHHEHGDEEHGHHCHGKHGHCGHGDHGHTHHAHGHRCHGQDGNHEHGQHGRHDVTEAAAPADDLALRQPR
ncbi:precorrin-3B C(17)-methyltransferase [Paenibacillus sp. FSL R7-0337]|uniref:precorrin-3B C(17)-methyltransferase n=1 Tax=Paenibacillus sp. FSL R7-0337 TaxID=1926588 RepID=UPI00096FAAEA|nr:precorrin-3B C(17)-methyltransferase [Paenibacillus sp. FSL R7-0337]OMF92129.1 precorrin-3B C(17)-methyltransferase [Paenibacillus sp. FSL R7-0337]